MTRARRPRPPLAAAESPVPAVLERADASLLELVDHVLNKGLVVSGEVTLGLAGIDLIYVRLLALVCAADRVSEPVPTSRPQRRRSRTRAARRR